MKCESERLKFIFSTETILSGRDQQTSETQPDINQSFVPSRGRTIEGVAAAAVSGRQPSGRALPSLVLGEHSIPSEHVTAALAVSPLASLINTALPMRARGVMAAQVNDPTTCVERRNNALETSNVANSKLQEYRTPWADRLPASSPARNINLPLLRVLVERFNYEDRKIANDISRGMPIAGDIPTCPVLTPRESAASETLEYWPRSIIPRNKEAIDRAQKFRNTELGGERWGGIRT